MRIIPTDIPGVIIIEPTAHQDGRGWFMEVWCRQGYTACGLPAEFPQDNVACSDQGVLRGLHFQHPRGQGKLVYVLQGSIFDVAVDVRRGSPTFGRFAAAILSDKNHRQLYVPEGFAHGYCVISPTAIVGYKCTREYAPQCEQTVRWNDPALAIPWPFLAPILSDKDAVALCLHQLSTVQLPSFQTGAVIVSSAA